MMMNDDDDHDNEGELGFGGDDQVSWEYIAMAAAVYLVKSVRTV